MANIHKVGIMGGTFNPIHNGHLLLAQEALEYLELDEILFIPSGNSYMKRSDEILGADIRVQMIKLAIKGNERFALSTCEIDRKGPTYTCDTLTELKSKNPDTRYFFIVGGDSLLSLKSWKQPAVIFQNCTIAATARGEISLQQAEAEARLLKAEFGADIRVMPARYIDISSTEIRRRLKRQLPVRYMLPDEVLQYIEGNRLYQQAGERNKGHESCRH